MIDRQKPYLASTVNSVFHGRYCLSESLKIQVHRICCIYTAITHIFRFFLLKTRLPFLFNPISHVAPAEPRRFCETRLRFRDYYSQNHRVLQFSHYQRFLSVRFHHRRWRLLDEWFLPFSTDHCRPGGLCWIFSLIKTMELTKHVFDVIFGGLLIGNVSKFFLFLGVHIFLSHRLILKNT